MPLSRLCWKYNRSCTKVCICKVYFLVAVQTAGSFPTATAIWKPCAVSLTLCEAYWKLLQKVGDLPNSDHRSETSRISYNSGGMHTAMVSLLCVICTANTNYHPKHSSHFCPGADSQTIICYWEMPFSPVWPATYGIMIFSSSNWSCAWMC